jgi:predicted transcriptional regulator
MAVQVQIDERLYKQLEALAEKQGTEVEQLVNDAVEDYVEREERALRIDQISDRLLEEHAWLFNELAKR